MGDTGSCTRNVHIFVLVSDLLFKVLWTYDMVLQYNNQFYTNFSFLYLLKITESLLFLMFSVGIEVER